MEKMKLFISYGHEKKHIKIIEMIERELSLSHDVFRDLKIKSAEDWRARIHGEIVDSNGVVAFLTKYSMRGSKKRPGVCLNELSIAISVPEMKIISILLEKEKTIKPPSTLSATQWIDMSDWRKKEKLGEAEFKAYFDEKFALIKEAIESEENLRIHSEIEGLRLSLQPDVSKTKFYSLLKKPLTGREWLNDRSESFFRDKNSKRFLCIYGGPGYGKSHFTAYKIHFHPQVVAGYFFEYDKRSDTAVRDFVLSVAFQMATRLPEYRLSLIRKLKDTNRYYSPKDSTADNSITIKPNLSWTEKMSDNELFRFLITDHCLIDGNSDNLIIAIDGIDEAEHGAINPLTKLLCSDAVSLLPPQIKFMISTRKEEEIRLYFQSLDAQTLDLDCQESEEDITKYLRKRLKKYIRSRKLTEETINSIAGRCEKTFIFAERLCDAYEEDNTLFDDTEKLPKNINGLYFLYFSRLFENTDYEDVKKALSVIVANSGEIKEDLLVSVLGWSFSELEIFLQKMRSFVKESFDMHSMVISFYHKTINEWITDRASAGKYTVDITQGQQLILSFCEKCIKAVKESPVYWGFTGNKNTLTYSEYRFTYEKINAFGSAKQKKELKYDLRFLYEMQLLAYRNSDLDFAQKISEKISDSFFNLSQSEKSSAEAFFVASKTLFAETALTREDASALSLFEDIEKMHSDILQKAIPLYCCIERNICFLLRKKSPEKAEKRITELISFIKEHNYEEKEADIAQCLYHLCVIQFDLKKYEQAIETGLKAKEYASEFFDVPERLYTLTDNQLGSCYYHLSLQNKDNITEKIKNLETQLKYKKSSLDSRLKIYGKYSRYTALAYDYYARAQLDLHRAKKEKISEEAHENADTALKITAYTMGTDSLRYARSLLTKTYLFEEENKLSEALEYAQKAYEIQKTFAEHDTTATLSGSAAVNRIKEARKKQKKTD